MAKAETDSDKICLFIEIAKDFNSKCADDAHFTGVPEIDSKINDIKNYPHLFVLACLMDRQVKAEKAWKIPYLVCRDLCNGDFSFNRLPDLSLEEVAYYFENEGLHRFNNDMAKIFVSAVKKINKEYNGDASLIWEGENSSAEIIFRFLQFDGCGIKIASMATNLLHRIFGINYTDYSALDISPDIHVRRVFYRLGLIDNINDDNSAISVIYKARSLHPTFPGIFDKCCWNIGREYCHPSTPQCDDCKLTTICKKRT